MTNYNDYFQNLHASNNSNPTNPDIPSVIDTLYYIYQELHPIDSEEISAAFSELHKVLNRLPLSDVDAVIDKTCVLCVEHGKRGFQEGLALGFRLSSELRQFVPNECKL